ncbi:ATP-binding cassette domain-containing protein [Undibacterium arcticum]
MMGKTLVVQDLNLSVREHEFLTMLGPSGSGKTTCLMMLAGFETATSGEILLAGKAINRIPPERRDIGMVFQNYALFPHMSIRENLEFPLAVRKSPARRKKAEDRRRAGDGEHVWPRRAHARPVVRRAAATHCSGARIGVRAQAGVDG